MVSNFEEKPIGDQGWINGGFFVLEPEVIDLIDNDLTIWEREPLETLSKKRQLAAYNHKGFWEAMDTLEIKAVDKLLSLMEISEDIQTSILTFNINSSEPRLAVEINQLFIDELDSHQRRYNKAKTSQTRQFIEERIIDTEKELMGSEEDLKVFMDRNRRIENSPALQLEKQRLGREVSVLTGVYTTLKQQLETTKIEEVKESDYVIILDAPEAPLDRAKPNKKLLVLLAGVLGIGMGMVIGFVKDMIENNNKEKQKELSKAKSIIIQNIIDLFHIKK